MVGSGKPVNFEVRTDTANAGQLYKDMPQLIGRSAEDLDWQRLGLENFFHDDSPEDQLELIDDVKAKLD